MKRFFVLTFILVIGATIVAERFPRVHALVPWLPAIPGVTAIQTATNTPEGETGGERGAGKRRFGADGPIPVLTSPVSTADVPITADVLGTIQATNSVTVKSQVDGKLVEIDFREGQDVKKGDLIARIDPATYKALYDSAVAKKAQDEAQLANAQVDLVRYQKLAETQYGSHQQADTQKALVAQYTGQLAQDQASIDDTKATLDYATIRSPIDGRTGIRIVDQGNIVHASDTTGIVTIAEIKPIAAIFNLPQQWLRQVNAAQAQGNLKLEALDGDNGEVLDTGTLQVIDNTVDQTTGTVKMKGSFPNANGQLWPGQFVNLRLYVDTLHDVVVVPTPAVQRGPDGAFVYVVKDEQGRDDQGDDRAPDRDRHGPHGRPCSTGRCGDDRLHAFDRRRQGLRLQARPGGRQARPAGTGPPGGRPEASASDAKPAAEGDDGAEAAKDDAAPKASSIDAAAKIGAQAGATN